MTARLRRWWTGGHLGSGFHVARRAGLQAQSTTGTLLGTVLDGEGGVLVGATVTATQRDTGFTRTLHDRCRRRLRLRLHAAGPLPDQGRAGRLQGQGRGTGDARRRPEAAHGRRARAGAGPGDARGLGSGHPAADRPARRQPDRPGEGDQGPAPERPRLLLAAPAGQRRPGHLERPGRRHHQRHLLRQRHAAGGELRDPRRRADVLRARVGRRPAPQRGRDQRVQGPDLGLLRRVRPHRGRRDLHPDEGRHQRASTAAPSSSTGTTR